MPGAAALHFPGPRSIEAAWERPGAPGGHCTVHWEDFHLHAAWLEMTGWVHDFGRVLFVIFGCWMAENPKWMTSWGTPMTGNLYLVEETSWGDDLFWGGSSFCVAHLPGECP